MELYTRFRGIMIKVRFVLVFCILSLISSCVDPFEIETENFENILVINATITNELKTQEVLLTRTFKFEDDGPQSETGATVRIIDDANFEYTFEESDSGVYRSTQEFAATSGRTYRMSIQTADGRSYISDVVTLPQETSIDNVYPQRVSNDDGVEGLGIFVDTFDPTGNSQYYRYEFEETYRIVAPLWYQFDLVVTDRTEDFFVFGVEDRSEDGTVCFKTEVSNNINIANTTFLEEDRITGLQVNFMPANDIRIADRYSILVRQYVQSRDANGFYEILSSFSESESLFSQIQPGFITGNIVSETNPDEKVLGFFDVSSVSEQRIFVNRNDFLADLPVFELDCELVVPEQGLDDLITFHQRVEGFINSSAVSYFPNAPIQIDQPINVFSFIPRVCGDCRVIGKVSVPDFWVD
ncbi:DUF4249 domain-containing protein [Aquimarina litoralis]|uniref:DUF4249 domain-containing protein n=1 Tax=Aquimarina litoralis TaxID=584605 RepID=UPI001C5982A5|nr:DUF4249 domain-containing protein [Aquimarina litoralis]MBW1295705.1 DUF4249 family protein [Aquimarina litoralis]